MVAGGTCVMAGGTCVMAEGTDVVAEGTRRSAEGHKCEWKEEWRSRRRALAQILEGTV
jgi:hypothetical protein